MAGTIQKIADIAGVSRGTVDRVLNKRGGVKPEVAQKIQKIAEEIGYVHKRKGIIDKRKHIKIGVITQLSKSSFTSEIQRGIEAAGKMLVVTGVELIIKEIETVDEYAQKKCIDELVEDGVSGIALMPVESNIIRSSINDLVENKNIPVVTFNSDIIGTKRSCFVGLDNRKSGKTAAGLMAMLTSGKGKVLIITGFFSNNVNNQRVDGFIEEIKESFNDIELIGVQCSFDDALEVEKIILGAMENFNDLKGIFVVSSGQDGIKKAFESLNIKQRPYVIIYDDTAINESILKDNFADFLIDQELYFQGYKAPFILSDILIENKMPKDEYIYTHINIKTKYSI